MIPLRCPICNTEGLTIQEEYNDFNIVCINCHARWFGENNNQKIKEMFAK